MGKSKQFKRKQPGYNSLVLASVVGFMGGWALVDAARTGAVDASDVEAVEDSKQQTSKVKSSVTQKIISVAIGVLLIVGIVSIGVGLVEKSSGPTLDFKANGLVPGEGTVVPAPSNALSYSAPISISVPAADVSSQIINVGKGADGRIEVPSGHNYNLAAWYKNSPTPGQVGASVIIGHVDSFEGASVFYKIEELRIGDEIFITRADGSKVVFVVQAVRQYERDEFPSSTVYISKTNQPELRLITCGGEFSETSGEYLKNTVVYATMKKE